MGGIDCFGSAYLRDIPSRPDGGDGTFRIFIEQFGYLGVSILYRIRNNVPQFRLYDLDLRIELEHFLKFIVTDRTYRHPVKSVEHKDVALAVDIVSELYRQLFTDIKIIRGGVVNR